MSYIPPDVKWYLAEIVVEFSIESESANVVHTNLVLVRSDSPTEAYDQAISLGADYNSEYTNPEGKRVTARFRGLRDLNVIHGELKHGTELIYSLKTAMSEKELNEWVSSRKELGVFRT